jgi:intraflagellar transport protein 52
MGDDEGDGGSGAGKVILLNASKRETHTAAAGLKRLSRRLRGAYKVAVNKEPLSLERLKEAALVVFAGPRDKFTAGEFDALKAYLSGGGSVMMLLGEGGEGKSGTNVNFLLEEYGISFNNDAVARTVFYKYLHPKEVLVSNGVLNRGVSEAAKRLASGKAAPSGGSVGGGGGGGSAAKAAARAKASVGGAKKDGRRGDNDGSGLTFVYPYGSTLNVQKPAVALLSSGPIAYPLNRPLVAVAQTKGSPTWDRKEGGRIVAVGSVDIFGDDYAGKEENDRLFDVLLKWSLCEDGVVLDHADAEDPEVGDYHHIPHVEALAERLRSCLQEAEPLPRDLADLFDDTQFKFDTNVVPEAVMLYKQLGVKHEPLSLIPPQFEAPLPPLIPAVFPPAMREPPPPALDQFDLDEEFATERLRLAQLTNKCQDEDLEYYVRESGEILGVHKEMGLEPEELRGEHGAKRVLEYILKQLVRFKNLNQDAPAGAEKTGASAMDAENRASSANYADETRTAPGKHAQHQEQKVDQRFEDDEAKW